ncbi:hypothetical protein E2C01_101848 [Portunus trituberculatus]|uniref:Uncharacterized protein n=1 Tax=Portunus trituberculatus TaxID=210409 RepID=A0A5B7KH20_PORTR|nr:hypothetical protein [Portunus trituberculatus]
MKTPLKTHQNLNIVKKKKVVKMETKGADKIRNTCSKQTKALSRSSCSGSSIQRRYCITRHKSSLALRRKKNAPLN